MLILQSSTFVIQTFKSIILKKNANLIIIKISCTDSHKIFRIHFVLWPKLLQNVVSNALHKVMKVIEEKILKKSHS